MQESLDMEVVRDMPMDTLGVAAGEWEVQWLDW